MKTFTGQYSNGNFVYSNDTEAIRAQLISILNTQLGSRFYYPSYGSRLNDYRFDVINYFTINMIAQEIKNERNQRLVGADDVKKKFKSAMDEYLERTKECLK